MGRQLPPVTSRLLRLGLVVVTVVGLAGCLGDDDTTGEDGSGDPADGAETSDADVATGTLVLGSRSIEFSVDACDLAPDPPVGRATLSGHAELPDGRTLQVTMLRTPMGSTTWHSVALDFGDEYREARRGRFEGQAGWRPILADSSDSAVGPLITIEGRRVAAEGVFLPGSGGTSKPVPGSVSAICPEA